MLVEVPGDEEYVRAFASAVGEPVEYYEAEKCGRWYPDIQSYGQRSTVLEQIYELSRRFPLIVIDGAIDGVGCSAFHEPGARFDAFYRVVMKDGHYRILDEGWEDDEVGEGQGFTFYRIKDGVEYDSPLVEESPDPNDYETMLVYGCGDDLSHTPVHDDLLMPAITAPTFRLILPEEVPEADWSKEGF
jgi:hypothetical protein